MSNELKELRDENGDLISPILADDMKNYLIDIDGTITEDVSFFIPFIESF